MSLDIERLVGGLTPANPGDPRTFPSVWNATADDLEQLDGDVTTLTGRVDNLTTDEVAEGTNLYYTDGRVEDVIAASTTDDLAEGATNLYYTDARAEAAADGRIAAATTDDLSEGSTNLYYTDARAEAAADGRIAAATTDDLTEGTTNLYYTDARVLAVAAPLLFEENLQTANYTLALSDSAKVVAMNSASALTVTVPPDSSVAFPIGTVVNVYRVGTGSVTVAAGSGVTVRNAGAIRTQFGEVSLRKRGTDEWVLSGDVA